MRLPYSEDTSSGLPAARLQSGGPSVSLPEVGNEEDEGDEEEEDSQELALAAYFDTVNAEGKAITPAATPSSAGTPVRKARAAQNSSDANTQQFDVRLSPVSRGAVGEAMLQVESLYPTVLPAPALAPAPVRSPHLSILVPRRASVVAPDSVSVAISTHVAHSTAPRQSLHGREPTSSSIHSPTGISSQPPSLPPSSRLRVETSEKVDTAASDLPFPSSPMRRSRSTRWASITNAAESDKPSGRTPAEMRRARFYDYLGLCLNRNVSNSEAAPWEQTFQRDSLPGWLSFLRKSCVLALGVLVLLFASDYVNGSLYSDTLPKLLIIRYAIAAPALIGFFCLTFFPIFLSSWWFTQISTSITILTIGIAIIATSIVGGQPGYGVLALYVVYSLNFTILALVLRITVLTVLILTFTIASNTTGVTRGNSTTGIFFVYLLAFTISEGIPVFLREHTIRQNYLRQWRIDIERRDLAVEQARSNKLLENLLPPIIVTRLRAANKQLIADTFDDVSVRFVWGQPAVEAILK